ncbi:MAG: hypothetical protein JWN98_702 [Abditibacteriota bacterium]|nr:hypothetical protein [Abditibacteriota bacterium]
MTPTHKDSGRQCVATMVTVIAMPLLASSLSAQSGIAVRLNGEPVVFREAAPAKISGSVLVPMRDVFSAMRANVQYLAPTRTIIAKRGQREIQLVLGSTQGLLNGQPLALSQPAQLLRGSTFVPLRFVADALGAKVDWNEGTQTVFITDPTVGAPATPTIDQPSPFAGGVTGTVQRVDTEFPARIVLREGQQVRALELAQNVVAYRQTSIGTGVNNRPAYGPSVPIELSSIVPNEEVTVSLNAQNQVTQIVAQRAVQTARVRSVQGNQIVLDNGLAVPINSFVRYISPTGQASQTVDVRAGQTVAIFVRPSTNAVYQISASQNDIAAASAVTVDNGNFGNDNPGTGNLGNGGDVTFPPNNLPAGTPRVELVQHNAAQALRAGQTLVVTVRGAANLRGTFDISPRLQNLPLQQTGQPGVYRGTYVVKAGDDVLNGRITARLTGANGDEDAAQSQQTITIDTVAPREVRISPANNTVVNDARPTLIITVDDIGGSGLATATATVTANGRVLNNVPATIVPPSEVHVQMPQAVTGAISVKVNVTDAARNTRSIFSNFTVQARQGAIRSVTHSATRPLRAGESLRVDMLAQPGGRATFEVLGENNEVLVARQPMTELNVGEGRYQGNYTLANNLNAERVRVRVRFVDPGGQVDTADAANQVLVVRDSVATQFSITQPQENGVATSPLTVRGRAIPGALVDVTVTGRGTKTLGGILAYGQHQQVVDTQQVQADDRGNWVTRPITLSRPRNVTELRFEISAVQTDLGNRRSQPQVVTITPED